MLTTAEVPTLSALLPTGVRHVAVFPGEADASELFAEELAVAPDGASDRRQFIAGRIGAHACMSSLGVPNEPLLRRADGAPAWPSTIRGSISHKPDLCVVVAAAATDVSRIGVDVEPTRPLPRVVWSVVLTAHELSRQSDSGKAMNPSIGRLPFAAKEAYSKLLSSGPDSESMARFDFHDIEVDANEGLLHFSSTEAAGVAGVDVRGAYVIGPNWTIAAVWTLAMQHAS